MLIGVFVASMCVIDMCVHDGVVKCTVVGLMCVLRLMIVCGMVLIIVVSICAENQFGMLMCLTYYVYVCVFV